MKKLISLFILIFISSCNLETNKDKEIVLLKKTIINQKLEIEKLQKKNEINAKIERVRSIKSNIIEKKLKSDIEKLKSQNNNNLQEEETLILQKEKEIDVKFYSQFPLDIAT
jgi:predicted Holliday junction resolvase-like endonuclease